jgi:hypothetical protein
MKVRHVVLLGIALFIFLYRQRPQRFLGSPTGTKSAPETFRITQFYAAEPNIALGEKTLLCYGVEGAKAVRLQPAVEQVWPALVRCFDVIPAHTTTYTLIAEDAKGELLSQSTTIEVGPARPKLVDISVNKLEVAPGEQVVVCLKAQHTTSFDVGALKPLSALGGRLLPSTDRRCFSDHPRKTTAYLVKAMGPGGMDSEKITVKVK